MGRGTYIAHNAYSDSGAAFGLLSVLPAAYIEAVTERPFASFFNALSGASIGGVITASLAIGAPAIELAHSIYACSIDLLNRSSQSLVVSQILNQKIFGGHHVLADHFDHSVLYRMLAPRYGDTTMSDLPVSLVLSAHNMTKKRDELLGRLDSRLFDTGALAMELVNGTTRLIDGVMAGTSIPSVFMPYTVKGSHYRDNGMVISAGLIHKELDAALKARQQALHAGNINPDISRRGFLSFGRAGAAPAKFRTLANTDHALVRTLFLGTGDMSELPYTPERQVHAGFFGAIDNAEYSTLHATKAGAWAQDRRDMARGYDPASMAATGMPAITPINRSIIPRQGTEEERLFPTSNPLDCTPANLHKIFYVAALNVADNVGKLGAMLHEIAVTRYAQGDIDADEYRKSCADAHRIATQDPWPILERIMVTDRNGQEIYNRYSQEKRRRVRWPRLEAVA